MRKEKAGKKRKALKLNTKFTLVTAFFVIVPVTILSSILCFKMTENVVEDNMTNIEYQMEQNQQVVEESIQKVKQITGYFVNDNTLKDVLRNSVTGDLMTEEELMKFYSTNISELDRKISGVTNLYGVRVYASTDNVQEVMPLLYNHSRMLRQEWSSQKKFSGWYVNYRDSIFSNLYNESNPRLASLITPITDYGYGTIGVVEASVTMEDLFPVLYGTNQNQLGCFIESKGSMNFGEKNYGNLDVMIAQEAAKTNNDGNIHTYRLDYQDSKYIISYYYIEEFDGKLFCIQDITENMADIDKVRNSFLVVMFLVVIVVSLIVNWIVRRLLKHFYAILKSIRQVQQGNLDIRIENDINDEMGELGEQINVMLDYIRHLIEDNINREVLVKNSEIRALQNQINAHFIYNVLESIKMMAEIDEEYAISDAITSLGKLLRYTMKWVSGNVKVEEELEYIRDYLALINLRVDYEIYLSLNIPEIILKQDIPKMSLQPIVENAIYHGIEDMAEDTNIYIKGIIDGDDFVLEVTDAGKGMTEEELDRVRRKIAGEIETSGGSGNGIGLKNVQDRVKMSFGSDYGISIASMIGCYTKVMLRIPFTNIQYNPMSDGEK